MIRVLCIFGVMLTVGCVSIGSGGLVINVPKLPVGLTKKTPQTTTDNHVGQDEVNDADKENTEQATLNQAINSALIATNPTSEQAVAEETPLVDVSHRYKYEVKGQEYKVFHSEKNFQEIGIASWYGPGFHGKLTASGEPYDMHAMTAAHKTLPLGTWVQVSNLSNGRKVIVRINDRGPFHKGRVIDVSRAAASQLGILARGHARVHLKTVDRK